jgi:hypothetical protein
LPKEGFRNT